MSLHDAYINHVMACPSCYAPNNRYCGAGASARADYLVEYLMEQPQAVSRSMMICEKRDNPTLFPLLNQRVREKLAEREAETHG